MSWDKVEKDISGGPWGLLKWFAIPVIILTLFFGALNALMKPANMAVDRIVTKQSFQYKEGMEQRAAILQANIVELEVQIQQYPLKRNELLGQKRILEAQLNAITINQ